MTKYFDIHSHINLDPLLANKDEVIKRLEENEVGTITIGTDYDMSLEAIELAEAE